jgi:hypothetical protein
VVANGQLHRFFQEIDATTYAQNAWEKCPGEKDPTFGESPVPNRYSTQQTTHRFRDGGFDLSEN